MYDDNGNKTLELLVRVPAWRRDEFSGIMARLDQHRLSVSQGDESVRLRRPRTRAGNSGDAATTQCPTQIRAKLSATPQQVALRVPAEASMPPGVGSSFDSLQSPAGNHQDAFMNVPLVASSMPNLR